MSVDYISPILTFTAPDGCPSQGVVATSLNAAGETERHALVLHAIPSAAALREFMENPGPNVDLNTSTEESLLWAAWRNANSVSRGIRVEASDLRTEALADQIRVNPLAVTLPTPTPVAEPVAEPEPVDGFAAKIDTLSRLWKKLYEYASGQGWLADLDEFSGAHEYVACRVTREFRVTGTRLDLASRYVRRESMNEITSWTPTSDAEVTVSVMPDKFDDEQAVDAAIETLWSELDEKSADGQWCTVYTDFCDEFGRERPNRERDYQVTGYAEITVRVPISWTVTSTSTDEGDVVAQAENEFVLDSEEIANGLGVSTRVISDWDWSEDRINFEDSEAL